MGITIGTNEEERLGKNIQGELCKSFSQLAAEHSQMLFSANVSTYFFLLQPIPTSAHNDSVHNNFAYQNSSCNEEIMEKCLNRIRSFLSVQASICCHQLLGDGSAIFLLSFPDENAYQPMLYELNIQLTFISEQDGVNYYIGTERFSSMEQLNLTLEHAMECIRLLESIHARRGVCSYDNITFVRMFGMLHRNNPSIVLDNQALQVLLNYDRKNQTGYVHTLRTYLADNRRTALYPSAYPDETLRQNKRAFRNQF